MSFSSPIVGEGKGECRSARSQGKPRFLGEFEVSPAISGIGVSVYFT